ncbi:MAG TPA: S16 family serine protease, partial [Chloroflexota bacterium]|nr:S16 family serine protease [Chloroflexota bacterium]
LSHRPGSVLRMTILRQGRVRNVKVPTIRADNCGNAVAHGGHTLVGISMIQPLRIPVRVRIATGDVGGPSAGLAFALGIVEQLTGRDLTHGNKVAATGTIQLNEQRLPGGRTAFDSPVGPIGGARQKALAAQAAGAAYFLVPVANYADALSAHAHLKVIAVRDLRQALAVLAHLPSPKH